MRPEQGVVVGMAALDGDQRDKVNGQGERNSSDADERYIEDIPGEQAAKHCHTECDICSPSDEMPLDARLAAQVSDADQEEVRNSQDRSQQERREHDQEDRDATTAEDWATAGDECSVVEQHVPLYPFRCGGRKLINIW